MRVIVTGSRDVGRDPNVARGIIASWLFDLPTDSIIVHGAARGVDRIAGQEAEKLGLLVEEHPADWDLYGKSAGFVRNKYMASLGADLCVAFWDGVSRGTQHMMQMARAHDIPVEWVRL